MPFDNERDDKRDESREVKYAQARRRAKMRERVGDDEDVDWSKTRQIAPARSVKSSNLVAFGVPFAVASIALLWFSLHDRDKEVNPTAPTSFQASLKENLKEKELESDVEKFADAAQRVDRVALLDEALENIENAEIPGDFGDDFLATDDSPLPEFGDDLVDVGESNLPELGDNLVDAGESSLPELGDDLDDLLSSESAPTSAGSVDVAEPSLPDETLDDALPLLIDETSGLDELAPEASTADETATLIDDLVSDDAPELDPTALPDLGIDSALENLENEAPAINVDPLVSDASAPELNDANLDATEPADETAALPENDVPTDPSESIDPTAEETTSETLEAEASDFPDDSDAIEAIRSQLAQLEFDFAKIRKEDSRDVDALLASVDDLLARAREVEASAPDVAQPDVASFAGRVQEFQAFLERNAEFFQRLETLDDAALDSQSVRAFFAPYLNGAETAQNDDPEIAAFKSELARAGKALDALRTVDEWNDFIETRGEKLEKFRVNAADASLGLRFIEATTPKPGAPQDLETMAKRVPEWRFELTRNVGAYRKIVLMFEKELSQSYWTYAPERNRYYYLTAAPRAGANAYVSSPKSDVMQTQIPADAPELELKESPQKEALALVMKKAWTLTDELRDSDPAEWYKGWSEVLKELHDSETVDPIIQYTFLHETARRLSESDYYFKRRLEPLLNVLNAPQLEKKSAVDRFSTDSPETIKLRDLAISRVKFLPMDHLEVTKTTAELDATVGRFAYLYKAVGWLDRNFVGEELCRRAENASEVDVTGPLFVYVVGEGDVPPRWIQVGRAENGLLRLDVATATIPRGSVVFCKTPLSGAPAVAKRDAIEDVLKR